MNESPSGCVRQVDIGGLIDERPISALQIRVFVLCALVALLAPSAARAQAGAGAIPDTVHACYVPATGTIYRIKMPGLPSACAASSHVEFSWLGGSGATGPTGATGPSGAAGATGATGATGE
jgi:hypothetical protein